MPAILDFRPSNAVSRLPAMSRACPLSLRDLLKGMEKQPGVVPIVRAPIAAVARAVLLAAKEAKSVVGLMIAADQPPEPWFAAVTGAADELATSHPHTLCGEVRAQSGSAADLERAAARAFKLIDAGVTHLAVDLSALKPKEQPTAMSAVAGIAFERELGVEWIVHRLGPTPKLSALGELREVYAALKSEGRAPTMLSAYQPAPPDEKAAQAQLDWFTAIEHTLALPLVRRGPISAHILKHLPKHGLRMFDDGGAILGAAGRGLPAALKAARGEGEPDPTQHPLEPVVIAHAREIAALPADASDRMEALAHMEALVLFESTQTAGSSAAVTSMLETRSGY